MQEHSGDWDFALVINLINSLSATTDDTPQQKLTEPLSASPPNEPANDRYQLGNFDSLWHFLGQPLNVPPPEITPLSEDTQVVDNNQEDTLSCKGVRWRDEVDGADLEDDNAIRCSPPLVSAVSDDIPGLTKGQRKKERRKQRKKALEDKLGVQAKVVPSSSDNESEKEQKLRQFDDRKSVIHEIIYGSPLKQNRYFLRTSITAHTKNGWPVSNPILNHNQAPSHSLKDLEGQSLEQAVSRKAILMKMLYDRFVDERQFLGSLNVMQRALIGANGAVDGIHVFVDASNIMIGFQDAFKLSRGFSVFMRIRPLPFSFLNLSLILERGRPTAKRVLAGSDNFSAIQEAQLIGYEANILDRVHKAKELTPRQRKFRNGYGISGQSSGSETNATHAPEKWVEQAVDEILHLKILESVVDAEEPSTIVLATGDAAEAEYSGGFLRMVERALEKGWKVELVSFSRNTSGAYRKKEFRMRWGQFFKVIELDDFVDVLLGV